MSTSFLLHQSHPQPPFKPLPPPCSGGKAEQPHSSLPRESTEHPSASTGAQQPPSLAAPSRVPSRKGWEEGWCSRNDTWSECCPWSWLSSWPSTSPLWFCPSYCLSFGSTPQMTSPSLLRLLMLGSGDGSFPLPQKAALRNLGGTSSPGDSWGASGKWGCPDFSRLESQLNEGCALSGMVEEEPLSFLCTKVKTCCLRNHFLCKSLGAEQSHWLISWTKQVRRGTSWGPILFPSCGNFSRRQR